MTNYKVTQLLAEGLFYVYADGVQVAGYATEAKANRRIRDMKAKELTKGIHGNLRKPLDELIADYNKQKV